MNVEGKLGLESLCP